MTGRTKLIIITSDEDLIEQFSLNRVNHTKILEFDSVGQTDENFLKKLSQTQSKRSLDSKPVKTSRRSLDAFCTICGDRAIGFNYDVLSCASCKAFFRRNAFKDKEQFRCLTGLGQCLIVPTDPHKCQKCRLERCLTAGMRKDFLQTEEQKQKRRKCIEENRNKTSQQLLTPIEPPVTTSNPETLSSEFDDLLMEMDQIGHDFLTAENENFNEFENLLFGSLSGEDWTIIQNLQSSFISFFQLPKPRGMDIVDLSNRFSALITWSTFINQLAMRFINFFRQISEFEHLELDDRVTLIKYNLFPVFPLCKCYNYKQEFTCPYDSNEEAEKHQRFFSLFGLADNIGHAFINVVISLVQITEQDPTLLSLLLLILFFTPGLSMNENQPPLINPLAVHRAQSHYTKVLWNYLLNQCEEIDVYRRFTQLLSLILRMQLATKDFRQFFREQCTALNVVEQITPLMQSVLNIS